MNNVSNNTNTIKRGRGRPRKDSTNKAPSAIDSNIHIILEPNIDDIHDELVRMDSFAYSRYNEQ